jgi:hypothetical protein
MPVGNIVLLSGDTDVAGTGLAIFPIHVCTGFFHPYLIQKSTSSVYINQTQTETKGSTGLL